MCARTRVRITTVNLRQKNDLVEKYKGTLKLRPGTSGYVNCSPQVLDGNFIANNANVIPYNTESDYEAMTDTIGTDHSAIKAVDHVKWTVPRFKGVDHADTGLGVDYLFTGPQLGAYYDNPPDYVYARCLRRDTLIPGWTAWNVAETNASLAFRTGTEASLLSWIGTAPTDRLGELPGRVVRTIEQWNASTTLLESRDLPKLYTMFKRGRATGTGLASIGEFLSGFRGTGLRTISGVRTMKNIVKAYHEGHLGYAFGIMPTVADVRQISEICRNGIKPRTQRTICTLKGNNSRTRSFRASAINGWHGLLSMEEQGLIHRVDGVRITRTRPAFYSEEFGNALDRLIGVNGARLIWDVLPWSFVVDWFLSVDDMLDNMWLMSQHEYQVEYWTSTKAQYKRFVSYESLPTTNLYRWKPCESISGEYSHYSRVLRSAPSVLDSARFRMGPKQAWLTLLLAIGLVPKNKLK